ncbi:hypothetical protein CEXT_657781 [Caerostris extrusa]|uniref:Uncharacterized protein n=1 Tax=Caerostris extrusa TaxID=172846 RepID=A0AAV4WUG9_CAEEX|nr:hypothetical protein CEXT_657781 [Caerostris extrusa]
MDCEEYFAKLKKLSVIRDTMFKALKNDIPTFDLPQHLQDIIQRRSTFTEHEICKYILEAEEKILSTHQMVDNSVKINFDYNILDLPKDSNEYENGWLSSYIHIKPTYFS